MVFTKHADNPLLGLGAGGTWDDLHVRSLNVLYRNNKWYMYYTGHDGFNYRIGLATSADGISWTKHPNNPLVDIGAGGAWDDSRVEVFAVIYRNNKWYLYYTGFTGATYRVGLATSADGISWTKHPSNPVLGLGAGGTWDDERAYFPSVLYRNNKWYMYYSGHDGTLFSVGLATSADGISWTKHPDNPLLTKGGGGTWDDERAYFPSVLYRNNKWYLYYCGFNGTLYRVGLATSADGISWTKHPSNPVLGVGAGAAWDNKRAYFPSVLYRNNKWYMYYSGYNDTTFLIGLATSLTGV